MYSHKLNPKVSAEFLLTFLLKSLECLPKVGAMENLIHFWRKLLPRNKKTHTSKGLKQWKSPHEFEVG